MFSRSRTEGQWGYEVLNFLGCVAYHVYLNVRLSFVWLAVTKRINELRAAIGAESRVQTTPWWWVTLARITPAASYAEYRMNWYYAVEIREKARSPMLPKGNKIKTTQLYYTEKKLLGCNSKALRAWCCHNLFVFLFFFPFQPFPTVSRSREREWEGRIMRLTSSFIRFNLLPIVMYFGFYA